MKYILMTKISILVDDFKKTMAICIHYKGVIT